MQNECGLVPMEFNVIVKKIDVEQRTKGGLFLPDDHRDRMQWREQRARVVSVSPSAFTFEANAPRVEPGDEVVIAKNAGGEVTGLDGEPYHIVKDTDIIARVAS